MDGIKTLPGQLGPLKSVTFKTVAPNGADVYTVAFEKGSTEWSIALGENGRIDGLGLRPVAAG